MRWKIEGLKNVMEDLRLKKAVRAEKTGQAPKTVDRTGSEIASWRSQSKRKFSAEVRRQTRSPVYSTGHWP